MERTFTRRPSSVTRSVNVPPVSAPTHMDQSVADDAGAGQRRGTSTVTISGEFYEAIMSGSVPLSAEALAELRAKTRSPMSLDIYAWLAHRLRNVKAPTPPIRWADLAVQFGGDYAEVRMFKRQFLKDLAHVMAVYPAAKVDATPKGLVLRRSPPPVPALESRGR